MECQLINAITITLNALLILTYLKVELSSTNGDICDGDSGTSIPSQERNGSTETPTAAWKR